MPCPAQAIDAALAGDPWPRDAVESTVAHPIRAASLHETFGAVP